MTTRYHIARIINAANHAGIKVWASNSHLPYPNQPFELVRALRETGIGFERTAFQDDLNGWNEREDKKTPYAQNIVDFENYERLVYAGFRLDECVASMSSGYVDTSKTHDVYIIQDAGLVNSIVLPTHWTHYPGRHPDPINPDYLFAESAFFCQTMAREVASILTTEEFERMVRE